MAGRTLNRAGSFKERLIGAVAASRNELLVGCLQKYVNLEKGMMSRQQLIAEFKAAFTKDEMEKLKGGVLADFLTAAQEAIVMPPLVALAIRLRPGVWEYVQANVNEPAVGELSPSEYLQLKEKLAHDGSLENFALESGF